MVTRRPVSALNASDRKAFVAAVLALKAAKSRLTPRTASRYDDYVFVHMQAMGTVQVHDPTKFVVDGNLTFHGQMNIQMPMDEDKMYAHGCPAFLPWHREFLLQFEKDLQCISGDPQMAIPYWDWSTCQDPDDPHGPWTEDFMGGNGDPVGPEGGPVTTGPFKAGGPWELTLTGKHCENPTAGENCKKLMRGFMSAAGAGRLPTPTEVLATLALNVYDSFPYNNKKNQEPGAVFRAQLEGQHLSPHADPTALPVDSYMHNLVHNWVGGTMSSITYAVNDPVFFLHHSNVDRIWALWQLTHFGPGNYQPTNVAAGVKEGQALNSAMFFYQEGVSTPPWPGLPIRPCDVLNIASLNYCYADNQPCPSQPTGLFSRIARWFGGR